MKIFKNYYLILTALIIVQCNKYDDIDYNEKALGFSDNMENYNENYKDHGENPFIKVADQPVSTFSIDADGGSYSNMRRYMNLGQLPPAASVRIEEYLNYFTFDYEAPSNGENVSLNSEITTCPWNPGHHLIRMGIKGKSIPATEFPASNYVFLIDVSGSMNYPEKLGILKSGFKLMVDHLKNNDQVAIVTYAGEAGVLLPSTHGDEKEKIKSAIDKLGAGGSTAGAQGIITAYEIAEKNFIAGGNNRVILGSDGDFNVGPSSTDELVNLIEEKRDKGIFLTVLGVGSGNLNDHMMEQVANNGNGNYEYIDNASQLQKVFVHEKSKFYTVAKDCKIQVTFNTEMVDSFRLIGYENRNLEDEDFENDSTDAGEIGAGQTITVIYEVVLNTNKKATGKFAQLDFRYKKPNENQSILISHEINSLPVPLETVSENTRFAISVAAFGLLMKKSKYKGSVTKQMVLELGSNSLGFDPHHFRQEYIDLVKNMSD
ncbi:MAG: vWA domain-containing protein [Bacteroidota bacterium]